MTKGLLQITQMKDWLRADVTWPGATQRGRLICESMLDGTRYFAARFGRTTSVMRVNEDLDEAGLSFDVTEVMVI